jgi:hypothetical protein
MLFVFLTLLYYIIIYPLTQQLLHDEIGGLIDTIFETNFPDPIVINDDTLLNDSTLKNVLENFSYDLYPDATTNTNPYLLYTLSNNYLDDISNSNINLNKIPNINPDLNIIKPVLKSELTRIKNNIFKSINPNIINNLIETYSTPDNLVTTNNQSIMYHTMYIAFTLFMLTTILTISFKLYYPKEINISHILIENVILFTIIGIIEYWFFITYAFKYIPLLPSELLTLVNTSIKNQLNIPFKYTNNPTTPPYLESDIPLIFS